MDLEERLRLRETLLGYEEHQQEIAELFATAPLDGEAAEVLKAARPLFERLHELVDELLPLGTPAEAVAHALRRSSAFRVETVLDYCGEHERTGGDAVDDVRLLLAEQVAAGRLSVEYVFDCPSCGNIADERDDLPSEPVTVVCHGGRCEGAERTIDPANARAIFVNADPDPALESWV
jgi:hypothetical protein